MQHFNKIKLLDNNQLYQLIHNDSIDKVTMNALKIEWSSRKLTTTEVSRIRNKYEEDFKKREAALHDKNWNPLYTAFAINHHFKYLALLKSQGRKKEAQMYMIELCLGLLLYFGIIIFLMFVIRVL